MKKYVHVIIWHYGMPGGIQDNAIEPIMRFRNAELINSGSCLIDNERNLQYKLSRKSAEDAVHILAKLGFRAVIREIK